MEEKTQQKSDGRRRKESFGRLVGATETYKDHAEWRMLQPKNLSILGLSKKKEWSQCHRESSWQGRRSHSCQKEKERRRLSRVPEYEWGESRTVASEREIRAGG